MSQTAQQSKRKNKTYSSNKLAPSQASHNESKRRNGGGKSQGSKNNKRRELLPQPNGGIQRIKPKSPYKKRDFPKTVFLKKSELSDICPLCNSAIGNDVTAIEFDQNLNPAHFSCVIKWVEQQEKINENEKLTYIGSGKFAVISKTQKLEIIRYVDLLTPNQGMIPKWKRELAITPELLVSMQPNLDKD